MTNKFISLVDGNRSGIAPNLSTRLTRPDCVSFTSRLRVLPILLLCLMLFIGVGNVWATGTTVTYAQSSTSAASVSSGTAPTGSSVSFSNTFSTKEQLTNGNTMTLTLSGYAGYKITGITLSMKSNKSSGSGTFSAVAGTTTLASISSNTAFTGWYDNSAWSQSYVDVHVTMTNSTYEIKKDEDVVITLNCPSGKSNNSLYCQSFAITYEAVASGCSNTPTMSFSPDEVVKTKGDDNFTKTVTISGMGSSQTVSYSSSDTDVAEVDALTGEVTIKAKGSTTITASVAESGDYCSASASYTLTVNNPSHKAFFYNGATLLNAGGTSFEEGTAVSYSGSTLESCDTGNGASTTFAGWATATWSGKVAMSDIEPEFYESTLPVMGDDDVTYYAVFCKGTSGYAKVTDAEDLADGDKIIIVNADETVAMGYDRGNNRATVDVTVTSSSCNPTIAAANTDETHVYEFTLGKSGDYWTIEDKLQSDTYLTATGGTGSSPKNNMGLSSTATEDKTKWSISINSSAEASIVVKGGATRNTIRYNSGNSPAIFSCYASGAQNAICIFKKASGTNYMTTCCTELGQINGSVSVTQTSAVVKLASAYAQASNADGYQLKVEGSSNYDGWTDVDKDDLTTSVGVTVNGLTCGTAYTAYLRAKGSGSYCEYGTESSVNFTTSKYSISVADGITNGTIAADKTTACAGETVTLTVTPSTTGNGYHLASWSLNDVDQDINTLSFDMPEGNATISGVFEANNVPMAINVTATDKATVTASATSALAGTNITLSCTNVAEGYQFFGWTVTAGGNSVTVTNPTSATEASFTMPNAITTVTADIRQMVTVTFKRDGVTYDTKSTHVGGTVTFPSNPTGLEGYPNFIGWAAAIDGIATSAPTLKSASDVITENVDYHAVFSSTPVATGNYVKITTLGELTDGKYVIVGEDNTSKNLAILKSEVYNQYYVGGTALTLTDGKIANPATKSILDFEYSTEQTGWTIKYDDTEGGYLALVVSNTHTNLKPNQNNAHYFTAAVNEGAWTLTSKTTSSPILYCLYNNSTPEFLGEGSYTSNNIYLFKQEFTQEFVTRQIVKHTISYNANTQESYTGTLPGSEEVIDGEDYTVSTAELGGRDGYNFVGWNTVNTASVGLTTIEDVDEDKTLYAIWYEIPSHKVYFYNGTTLLNGENGTDVLEGGAVAYSGETPVSCDEGEGASTTFAGWTTAKWTGKVAKSDITENTFFEGDLPVMGESNVTYYAVFCKNNDASALFEWAGGSSANLTALNNVNANSLGTTDYDANNHSPYLVKFDGTGDYIDITTTAVIDYVTVGVKMIGGNTASSITVKESANGTEFSDVQTLSISGAQNSTHELSTTQAFATTSRVVRLYFTKGANVGVGPITIMGAASKSNYMTTCLLDLGGISETVGLSQLTEGDNAGKLQATWTMASKDGLADNGIIINIYKDGETPTLVKTSAALSKDATSYVATDLTPDYCSEYYATLTPVRVDATYKEGVEQGKSAINCVVGAQYTYTGNYSHVAPKEGETVATNSCSSFSVEFEGTESYTLPDEISVTGVSTYTWENGVLSFDKANVTGDVTITINGVAPAVTTLSATPTALDFGTPVKDEVVTAKTFRISGVALTAGTITITSPNAGFTVSPTSIEVVAGNLDASEATEITVTPVTSAVGVFDGNITISGGGASTTVALTMEVKEIYTVNWYVNGSSTPARTQSGVSGTALTEIPNNFSSATDCMDKEFMGWATAPLAEASANAPEGMITNTSGMTISGNADYYAVFATKVSEGGYEKVTDVSVLTAGDKIVITNGGTQAMKAYAGTGNNCGQASITLNATEDKITSLSEEVCEFTLGGSAGAWTFFDGTYYLYDAGTSGNNYMKGKTEKDDACEWIISATNVTSRTNTAKPYMRYNGSNNIFSCYASSGQQTDVTLFRKTSAEYSAYVTTCPHITSVTLSAGIADHGSISFEQGGSAVTSVRTDGGVDVEVDVVASLDEGYELTGLSLTSEDVTGADKNEALTKITIPAGEEGTLTITPTITLIPKYSITFAKGDEAVTGSDPETIDPQYAGTPITLPANAYTYTDHKFDKWKVTYGETELDKAVGETFEMPAADVTITAQWLEILTAKISFMVGGEEKASINKEQEVEFTIDQDGSAWAPTGFTFVGWSTTEQADETEVAPTTITKYTPQAGVPEVMLYGIYSRHEDSGNQHYVLDYTDDGVKDMTLGYGTAVDVTATDGSQWVVKAFKSNGMQINKSSNGSIKVPNCPGNIVNIAVTGNSSKAIGFSESDYSGSGTITYVVQGTDATLQNLSFAGKTVTAGYIVPVSNANQITHIDVEFDASKNYYTSSPVEKVTVTFALAGGEGGCNNAIINKGSEFTICDAVPTKSHSEFAGWKNGDDVYVAGTAYTFDADITLTAQWNPLPTYTITYYVNGGSGAAPTQEDQYAGDQFTLAAAVMKDGYTFKGWEYNNKLYKAGKTFTMPAANVDFVANWKKDAVATEKMTLVTEAAALVDGLEFALGCSYGESNFAMAGDLGENKYMASVSGNAITLNNGLASFTDDVIILIAEQAANGWKIRKDASNYLKEISQKNLAWGTSADATVWTISFSEGNVKIETDNGWMQYNAGTTGNNPTAPRFTTYGATSNQKAIQMFSKATVVSSPNPVNISDLGNVSGETVVVTSGTTLVANEASAPEALVIQEGAKYVATAQTTTPVVHFSVTMGSENPAGDETTASEIENALNIILTTGGEIHYDITLGTSKEGVQADPNQWHAFTVPFPVDVLNGIYNAETGAKLTNEVDYAIMDYHGDIRANGQYGWKKFRGTLVPGTFYIMTVTGDVKTFRFKKAATGALPNHTSMGFTAYNGTGADGDQGWNGIGNPSWLGGKVGYNVQVLDPYSYTFVTKTANSTNFKPGTPFFYKASSNGTMDMLEANADANYAPARTPANEIKNVAITFGNEVFRDKLYISASEDALNSYENDKDLVKMIMSNTPKVAQIFGDAYGMKLSMVNTPLVNNNAEVALTLYAPQAGEYTISVSEVENADIYLTHEGTIIWNLSMGAYTNDFAKGNTEGYGLLLQAKAPSVATGVESAEANEAGVQKVIIEDKVFILRGGQMYDVTGKAVR